MKSTMDASVAAGIVASSLAASLAASAAPQDQQPPAPPAADTPPVEAAPPAPPAPDAVPGVWPPPPIPAPKSFDVTTIASRFTGAPPEPPPAEPPAPPVPDTGIPASPPQAVPGKAATQAELYTWARLRTEATALHKRVSETEAAFETAKAEAKRLAEEKAQVAAEKLESDRKVSELMDKVGKLSLAESPEFQAKYDLKRAELTSELSSALVKFAKVTPESAADEASRLLAASPAALSDMVANLNPAVGGMIMAIANRVSGIEAARSQELSNWRESSAASGYENARRSVVETAEVRRQFADKAIELAKAYGNPVYTSNDPQVRPEVEKLEQAFRGFVQTATEEQLVAAAAEGFSAAQLYDVVNQLSAENMQLRDQISGRTRAALPPMFAMAPYTPTAAPPPPPPANVTPVTRRANPEDMVRETFSRSLQSLGGVRAS